MTLMRVNSFPLASLDNPLRLFEDALPAFFGKTFASENSRSWTPAVDVSETEDALVFSAEVPGFEKDGLSISVDNGLLTLSGERKLERKSEEFHRIERVYGKFERSFSLPKAVESEKIKADLKNGVLTITLPKKEEAKPRQIPVTVQ